MGDTLRYAQKVRLADAEPRGDLSSTGFALAYPGDEYLVLQPGEKGGPFTVTVEAGAYAAEWYDVTGRKTRGAGKLAVKRDGPASFTSPFATPGPSVLHLRRVRSFAGSPGGTYAVGLAVHHRREQRQLDAGQAARHRREQTVSPLPG